MNIQLSTHDWLQLAYPIRLKLRDKFGIPKSEGTVVVDGQVKSDGTTYHDLSSLTIGKMQEFLGSESVDFAELFDAVLKKIDEELAPSPVLAQEIDPAQLYLDEWAAVFTRIKGQAQDKGLTGYLDSLIKRIFDIKPTVIQQNEGQKPKGKPGRPKKAK